MLTQSTLREILNSHKFNGFLDGNSPYLELGDRFVTQDLLNTLIEYSSYYSTLKDLNSPYILEVGAGSGRSIDLILNLHSVGKYVVVDIPPASWLAKRRLHSAHPETKIRMCNTKIELESSLESKDCDVIFIPPSLAPYLPSGYFDLMLAIDCLHEMNMETRVKYADLATRVSNSLYVKIWESAYIPLDKELIHAGDFPKYGFNQNWEVLNHGNSIFPGTMYEYLFKIKNSNQTPRI